VRVDWKVVETSG